MATFQQLQDKVLNHFGASDTEFRTEVKEAINDVIAEINDRVPRAVHLEATTTFTCTVGTSTVTSGVPSDLNYIQNIYLTANGKSSMPLIFLNRDEWNQKRYYDMTASEPAYYSIWDGTLYVAPKPDSAYPGTIDYLKYDSELVLDASTSLLTTHNQRWERLIILGAKSRMYDYMASDGQLIQKTAIDFERSLRHYMTWVKKNFNKSPDASRVRNWKEKPATLFYPAPLRHY